MSTAYPPRLIKYAFSSKRERNAATASTTSMTTGTYGHFPNSFLFYYAGPGEDFLSQRFHFRENNPYKDKMYAVTYFKGPGTVQMTLYATEDYAPPALAISATEKRFSSSVVVTAPPPPLSHGGASQTTQAKYNLRRNMHRFTLPVGSGGGRRNDDANGRLNGRMSASIDDSTLHEAQTFEWREERMTKPKMRRLVRLSQSAAGTDELIATWKEGSVPNREGRLASFEFASDESRRSLGEHGTLIAVSTVLAICAIMGAGVDGAASWLKEKELEEGYHPGYWEDSIGEANRSDVAPPPVGGSFWAYGDAR